MLRHTSGLTYGFTGKSAVQRLYAQAQLFRDLTNAEFVAEIAKLPLIEQPGAAGITAIPPTSSGASSRSYRAKPWARSCASAVSPLGMNDTRFFAPADKHERVAEAFAKDPTRGGGGASSTCAPRRALKWAGARYKQNQRERLRAFPADALSRRHARRRAHSLPPDDRVHDRGSSRPGGAHRHALPSLRPAPSASEFAQSAAIPEWRRRRGRLANTSGAASPARRSGSPAGGHDRADDDPGARPTQLYRQLFRFLANAALA